MRTYNLTGLYKAQQDHMPRQHKQTKNERIIELEKSLTACQAERDRYREALETIERGYVKEWDGGGDIFTSHPDPRIVARKALEGK